MTELTAKGSMLLLSPPGIADAKPLLAFWKPPPTALKSATAALPYPPPTAEREPPEKLASGGAPVFRGGFQKQGGPQFPQPPGAPRFKLGTPPPLPEKLFPGLVKGTGLP